MVKNASSAFLKQAAHQNRLLTGQGLRERFFSFWFNSFVYNQIWEDPRVDLEALQIHPTSRVLTIASGGCNLLNYLTADPGEILALDINRHHIYLSRLKLAALKHLPDYETFFEFFGRAASQHNTTNFERFIVPHLEEETRRYWQGESRWKRFFSGPRIEYFSDNFYNYAKLGYLLRIVHRFAKLSRKDPARMLEARTQAEQHLIFEETIAPFFDNKLIRLIGKLPIVRYSLGIPPQQFERMIEEYEGDVVDLFRERVKRLLCDFPVQDNYFTWQAVARQYDTQNRSALPDYLKEDGYKLCRQRAERVSILMHPLTDYLKLQPERSFDGYVFLDAQDWMSPQQIESLWSQVARTARPGARIIFRTGSSKSPVEQVLPISLRLKFYYHRERSVELHRQDRSAIYGGFHLYTFE